VDIGAEWDGLVPLANAQDWGVAPRPTAAQLQARVDAEARYAQRTHGAYLTPSGERAAIEDVEPCPEVWRQEQLRLSAEAAAEAALESGASGEEGRTPPQQPGQPNLAALLAPGAQLDFRVHRVRSRRFASGRQLFRFPVQLVPADAELAALFPDPEAHEPPMDLRTMPRCVFYSGFRAVLRVGVAV
jgi:hypothetical protein